MSFRKFHAHLIHNDHSSYVGHYGELSVFEGELYIHDGVTPGGTLISASGGGGGGSYTLPTASTIVKGGVKLDGTSITINGAGVIGVNSVDYSKIANAPTVPTKTSDLTNDSSFITLSSVTWNNVSGKPGFAAVATSGSYNDLTNKPTLFSGSYSDLSGKPTLFSGSYTDLTNKPSLFDGAYASLTGKPTLFSGAYADLTGKPTFASVATSGSYNDLTNKPNLFSGSYNDLTNRPTIPAAQVQTDWNAVSGMGVLLNKPTLSAVATSGAYSDLTGKPALFSGAYADLTGTPDLFSGAYADLTGKPSLAAVATSGAYSDLSGRPSIPADQVQTDWNAVSGMGVLLNKPNLATVATSGSYNDLTNKPSLFNGDYESLTNKPSLFSGAYSDLTGKPSLFSGNYNDLTNAPTIPSTLTDLGIADGTAGQVLTTDGSGNFTFTTITGGSSSIPTYISSGITAPGSAVVANDTNVSVNFSDGGSGRFVFKSNGQLQLAAGGDIVDHNGNSVLGTNTGNFTFSGSTLTSPTDGLIVIPNADDSTGIHTTNDRGRMWFDSANTFHLVVDNTYQHNFNADGTVGFGGGYTFPNTKGTAGQILVSDVSGFLTWQDQASGGSGFSGNYNDLTNTPYIPTSLTDLGITAGSDGQVLTLNSSLTPVWTTLSGGTNTGNITFNADTISSTNNIVDVNASDYSQISSNNSYMWVENGNANIQVDESTWSFSGGDLSAPGKILAAQSEGTYNGGFSFTGNEGGRDSGMFSATDGVVGFYANDEQVFNITTSGLQLNKNLDVNGNNIVSNGNAWSFGSDSTLTVPGRIEAQQGNDLVTRVFNPNSSGGVSYVVQNYQVDTDSRTTQFAVAPDSITLTTDFSGAQNTWTLDASGNLTLPAGGDIKDSNGNSVLGGGSGPTNEITNTDGYNTFAVSVANTGVISMNTIRGGLEFGAMPEVGGPTHLHIMRPSGQEGSTDLFFGDDYNYVKLPGLYGAGTQGVEIGSSFNSGAVSTWKFDTNGTFTPGSDNLQDIGSPTNRVRHIYVGPGSVTIGNSVLSESDTGKLVLPGLTRGTGYSVIEVEDTGDQTQTFSSAPVVIDYAYFLYMNGSINPPGYSAASYSVDQLDGEGYIDGITLNSGGGGIDEATAALLRSNTMLAYIGSSQDPIGQWNQNDWVSIPFKARVKAGDVEYEFSTGGGASALEGLDDVQLDGPSNGQVLTWNSNQEKWENQNPQGGSGAGNALTAGYYSVTLNSENGYLTTNYDGSDTSIIFPRENDLVIDSLAGSVVLSAGDSKEFTFTTAGDLLLPPGGDIKDSNGNSVLGGGGNANTGDILFNGNTIYIDNTNADIIVNGVDTGANILSKQYAQINYSSSGFPNAEEGKNNYVWVDATGATIQLWADQNNGDYNHNWQFGTDGTLTLPYNGDIKDSNGNSVLGGGGSTTKTWTNPNQNTWRIEEYSGGWAGGYDYPIAEATYTLVESQTDVNYFFIDTSAYPEQWQAIQWAEEYVINGVTVSASGYGVTSFPNYNVSLGGNVTYSSGDTVTIRYRNRNASPEAQVWWDAANSNSGNSNFRGAIIEYHAYCGNAGTVVGKIIIACDNYMSVSHEETMVGGDLGQYEFWMQGDTGQLKVRRVGTDSNNNDNQIWIQWTGKIFYGSDYYC